MRTTTPAFLALSTFALTMPVYASIRVPVTGFAVAPPARFVTERTTHRTLGIAVGLPSTTKGKVK